MDTYINAVVSILTGGWPLAVLIVALLYRKSLKDILSSLVNQVPRVQKAWGLELSPAERQNAVAEAISATEEFKQLPGVFRTDSVMEMERRFAALLSKVPADEHEARLRAALAATSLQASFERAYGAIFGSQIKALRAINAGTKQTSDIEHIFASAKAAYPPVYQDYTFDDWLRYLENFEFITRLDGQIAITSFGREFLGYLAHMGRNDRSF